MPLRFAEPASSKYEQPLTIRHLLDAGLRSASAQEIVQGDGPRFTYAQFRSRLARLAGVLETSGVSEGTTVAVLDWDSHRYLEAFFAVPMMGAVLLTANFRLSAAQLRYTLAHAGAEVLLVHEDFLPLIDQLRGELPEVRVVIALMEHAERDVPDWCAGEYEALLAGARAEYSFPDFDEDALATTFYTTGTTGLPKAVCFSHRQLVLHTLAVATTFGTAAAGRLRIGDVYMPLTPMFHVHAWGLPYVATMLGLKQVYPGRYEPARLLRLRAAEGVTFSHCVPTVLQMILSEADARSTRLDDWHFVIGGSAITRELFDEATIAGAVVVAGYGMSETGPVVAVGRPGTDRYDQVRSGVPVPLVSMRIVEQEEAEAEADDTSLGELLLRAPWLTPCYVGDKQASEDLWAGGWLHTQDIATMRVDGSMQVRDRLKDVIKSGGEWISSLALEDLISSMDAIAEVAVVGVADPKWQERPVAIVVARSAGNPTRAGVQAMLRDAAASGAIGRFAIVDQVYTVSTLPRTSVGKVDKKAIRLAIAEGELKPLE